MYGSRTEGYGEVRLRRCGLSREQNDWLVIRSSLFRRGLALSDADRHVDARPAMLIRPRTRRLVRRIRVCADARARVLNLDVAVRANTKNAVSPAGRKRRQAEQQKTSCGCTSEHMVSNLAPRVYDMRRRAINIRLQGITSRTSPLEGR